MTKEVHSSILGFKGQVAVVWFASQSMIFIQNTRLQIFSMALVQMVGLFEALLLITMLCLLVNSSFCSMATHYQQPLCLTVEHNCSLPPHTTHEAQPLDVGVFPPLKVQWTKVCHEFYQRNTGIIINFSLQMAGFRRAGVQYYRYY